MGNRIEYDVIRMKWGARGSSDVKCILNNNEDFANAYGSVSHEAVARTAEGIDPQDAKLTIAEYRLQRSVYDIKLLVPYYIAKILWLAPK